MLPSGAVKAKNHITIREWRGWVEGEGVCILSHLLYFIYFFFNLSDGMVSLSFITFNCTKNADINFGGDRLRYALWITEPHFSITLSSRILYMPQLLYISQVFDLRFKFGFLVNLANIRDTHTLCTIFKSANIPSLCYITGEKLATTYFIIFLFLLTSYLNIYLSV